MSQTWPTVHRFQSLKMFSKSSWLIFFVATTLCDAYLFTPFEIVDNYVDQFRSHVEETSRLAEEQRTVQPEYDSLSLEDAKLLIGELFFTFSSLLFIALQINIMKGFELWTKLSYFKNSECELKINGVNCSNIEPTDKSRFDHSYLLF